VPRDRDGSFGPKIVKKRQRRLAGVDELVISLAAKGLATGEIGAQLADVYAPALRAPATSSPDTRTALYSASSRHVTLQPMTYQKRAT
jgi:transposase-like protein